ncbi:MAG: helix-turn-helix transcriptional regulator [Clostridiales bacterium]|nr:helix-turn-helix transcriptional regulator [Clostridiales bacterium]
MAIKLTLRRLLGQRNMTQKELAEQTGIRPPTISAICTNTAKHLPINVIDQICLALNCEPGDWIKKEAAD